MGLKATFFKLLLLPVAFFVFSLPGKASEPVVDDFDSFLEPSLQINKARLYTVAGAQVVGYGTTLYLLNKLWYEEYPRQGFNFHNDFPDWLQMDKLGHATASYHLSRLGAQSFRWAGLDHRQSAWLGVISATSFLGVVEVLDGLSTGWGFSVADFTANKIGAFTFLGQELIWQQQKILWKYSFYPSEYSQYRPEVLGNNLPEKMLKDYNGMSFWLSSNLYSLSGENDFFPQWLNLAIGHSATGMITSRHYPFDSKSLDFPSFDRHRQWLISPDIDWQRIPTNNNLLKTLFAGLNLWKLPAPAIEYNSAEGWKLHLIYF
jgi:uncharacterized protein YfiM (DUF2279 family)